MVQFVIELLGKIFEILSHLTRFYLVSDLILLAQKNEYNKVTIRAQVIKISDPAKVGKGLTNQEVTIGCTCSRSTGIISELCF